MNISRISAVTPVIRINGSSGKEKKDEAGKKEQKENQSFEKTLIIKKRER